MKAKGARRLAIVGASARAAAFSALRAGYDVATADRFADADLAAACRATRVDEYPEGLAAWLAATDCDGWLYTGALENQPALIERMAKLRPLLGCSGEALRRARDPFVLQHELNGAGLLIPETVAGPHGLPPNGSWLCKTYRGASGAGVWALDDEQAASRCVEQRAVCQRLVEGVAASAAFIVSRGGARLLGVTRQVVGESWTGARRWQYAGSAGPLAVGRRILGQLTLLGTVLAERFDMRGVVGVDFVLAGQRAWIVEINPRYTASIEILERISGESVAAAHVAACVGSGSARGAPPAVNTDQQHGKAILFARRGVTISGEFAAWARGQSSIDPNQCSLADVPHEGEPIAAGQPVVTVFAAAPAAGYDGAMRMRVAEVERRLYSAI
ncbi:MAG: ATP-grasp domain-containing protein [Pirellulales bacterium]|nr:ATP-grasp domain-containing protein [Pirellulales bacterium]